MVNAPQRASLPTVGPNDVCAVLTEMRFDAVHGVVERMQHAGAIPPDGITAVPGNHSTRAGFISWPERTVNTTVLIDCSNAVAKVRAAMAINVVLHKLEEHLDSRLRYKTEAIIKRGKDPVAYGPRLEGIIIERP